METASYSDPVLSAKVLEVMATVKKKSSEPSYIDVMAERIIEEESSLRLEDVMRVLEESSDYKVGMGSGCSIPPRPKHWGARGIFGGNTYRN